MGTRPTATAALAGTGALPCRFSFVPCLAGADRLVALGFRHWMAGYQTGDIARWEECWILYEQSLGVSTAEDAVGDLSFWVRSITCATKREIEVFPGPCRGFCRDECMAASLIAAMQHGACPAFKACTAALLATDNCEAVLRHASVFAGTLRDAGQVLSPDLLVRATPARCRHLPPPQ
jgi:hypothetical protein